MVFWEEHKPNGPKNKGQKNGQKRAMHTHTHTQTTKRSQTNPSGGFSEFNTEWQTRVFLLCLDLTRIYGLATIHAHDEQIQTEWLSQ